MWFDLLKFEQHIWQDINYIYLYYYIYKRLNQLWIKFV
jgi:hypothetical protein